MVEDVERGRVVLLRFAMGAALLALTGCGGAAGDAQPTAGSNPDTTVAREAAASLGRAKDGAARATSPAGPLSCAAQIGVVAGRARAAVCRNVSPATHPPCNAANSCALIEDEIARSCALFDGQGAPMPGCDPAPTSGRAAAAVVERYYSALTARDYATAWQQWGPNGRPGQSFAQFEAGFARTRASTVKTGTLPPSEGAAGSIYQTVPVTVDATLDDGTRQRFVGSYGVRRVNGVDGATPEQLRWHLASARLQAVPRH